MRFGGHETFAVREGWLYKGLRLLHEDPELLVAPDVADWLGVGKNMGRSIRHWLVACGLAEVQGGMTKSRMKGFQPTALGNLVWNNDRFLLDPGTWWILHAELVRNEKHALTWNWFFNDFNAARFEKGVCVHGLKRHLEINGSRMPSERTLDRDVSCLLATYSRRVPPQDVDPEDAHDSPFQELGLMTHFRASAQFVANRRIKNVRWRIVGYVIARALEQDPAEAGRIDAMDLRFSELIRLRSGPVAVFCLNRESLFEQLQACEAASGEQLAVLGMAGERTVRLPRIQPQEWLESYYAELEEDELVTHA